MDLNRIKELAGTAQLNEVSDATVRSVIQRRQADNWEANDRYNVAGQTPESIERAKRRKELAAKKLGRTYDLAGDRLTRLDAKRRSAPALEAMRMAGMQIDEAYDDDDEDPDVKIAMKDKRQQEFEKKNSKAIKAAEDSADVSDEMKDSAAKAAAAEKKEAAAEKKETPAAEKKEAAAKGRKCSERGTACRAWLTAHPEATLSQFKAHAKELGMGVGNATTTFYAFKKKSKVAEAFMVFHPLDSNTVLAENTRMRRYEWIDLVEGAPYAEPMVFDSEFEAKSIVAGVSLMGQTGNVVKIVENDEPVDW